MSSETTENNHFAIQIRPPFPLPPPPPPAPPKIPSSFPAPVPQQQPRVSIDFAAEDLQQKVAFPFCRQIRQRRDNSWVISLIVILHVVVFVATMISNDCGKNSHGHCALKTLGRLSFQPLSENPLLGPSASVLDEMGALRHTLFTEHHQYWRLSTSPWLHAGLFHLIINLSSVIFVGIHLEQEFGPLRIGIIYLISAVAGSLVAALFIQDRPSVTSSGALFGLLGTTLSGLIRNWNVYTKKFDGLVAFLVILTINLILGLVPYVNNFSNIGGFLFGFLLGFVLLFKPLVGKAAQKAGLFEYDVKHAVRLRHKLDKPVLRSISLVIFSLLLVGVILVLLRGTNANKYCKWCQYIDCVPCKWWSCSDGKVFCESMLSAEQLTLTCSRNGIFRVFPFTNISQARFEDLCYLICS
ncbi:hypothetical protein ACH5RR_033885 [Cinchona calisaya]|uniref:RHOMBOID-like protein n=1 Tax=Cinchona calisaya TaxID=153742 RepID=A0ABD2Y9A1_9GENT